MALHSRLRHALRSGVLLAVWLTIGPSQGHPDELAAPSDRTISDELQLLKEEESISIEPPDRQPTSSLSSERYVMTDEDIREFGATDFPTLLRRILGLDARQGSEPELNSRVRIDSHLNTNRLLLVVDGHSIPIDTSDALSWNNIPVTLPEIKRLEVWNESASAIHGFNGYDAVIDIHTKTPVR